MRLTWRLSDGGRTSHKWAGATKVPALFLCEKSYSQTSL